MHDHLPKYGVSIPAPLGAKSQGPLVNQKSLHTFLDACGGVLQTENFCKPEKKKSMVYTLPARDTCSSFAQAPDFPCTLSYLGRREPHQCSWLTPASSSAPYPTCWGSRSPQPLALLCLPLTGSISPYRVVSGPGKTGIWGWVRSVVLRANSQAGNTKEALGSEATFGLTPPPTPPPPQTSGFGAMEVGLISS